MENPFESGADVFQHPMISLMINSLPLSGVSSLSLPHAFYRVRRDIRATFDDMLRHGDW